MTKRSAILKYAVAAALAAPLAALGQSSDGQQSAQPQAVQSELIIITLTPVQQRLLDQQRRESVFRTLDADSNGEISMAEAGVNTELLQAFNKLDGNSDSVIERQEFTQVHVKDGSSQTQPSARTSRSADEKWQSGARSSRSAGTGQSESAAAGGTTSEPSGQLPSRSIEERARGSDSGESVPSNTPGQPTR